ncbi:histidine kinase [Maritimibacter sp. 55A14]|uniref:sensor histidine kinase n=1 Tax=Maritimibacter sp. 55A14 TaxID=2174844 RepID=UPI000D60FCA3|nr:histidine kinase dimerization/phosphoacceptor domain -containing protein [Maritimibacter sp. 55A14]PWE33492.1 histidine kinase [Maritimibacter sp. 55A14]
MNGTEPSGLRALWASLPARLIVILTLALLPIGLISVYQTWEVQREARALSGAALMDRTESAAAQEREMIQTAFGAAETVSAARNVLSGFAPICDAFMSRLVDQNRFYVFAGFIGADGQLNCSSSAERRDLGGSVFFQGLLETPGPKVSTLPHELITGQTVLSVTLPVIEDGALLGFVWISMPNSIASIMLEDWTRTADLVIFDARGKILTTEITQDDVEAVLPAGAELAALSRRGRQTFRGLDRRGSIRDFAIVPIVEDKVYVLGSWAPGQGGLVPGTRQRLTLFFPLLMWLASAVVAYFGLHRLVIRHVRRLNAWMRLYSTGNFDVSRSRLNRAPSELESLAASFRMMAERLDQHEAERNRDLAEKTVLLKEVHHRVKNNLQLISSIMNMQIRSASSNEARRALHRVQDRVTALATIHRYLYSSSKLSQIEADRLLGEIVGQLVAVGCVDGAGNRIAISTRLSPVEIGPDQSVPLSLLASEAMMNAIKHCGANGGAQPWIEIALESPGDGQVRLSVANSRAAGPDPEGEGDEESAPSGLGSKLIGSFVAQLDGTLRTIREPDCFVLKVTFEIADVLAGEANAAE